VKSLYFSSGFNLHVALSYIFLDLMCLALESSGGVTCPVLHFSFTRSSVEHLGEDAHMTSKRMVSNKKPMIQFGMVNMLRGS
jgi:hypothetical protein